MTDEKTSDTKQILDLKLSFQPQKVKHLDLVK